VSKFRHIWGSLGEIGERLLSREEYQGQRLFFQHRVLITATKRLGKMRSGGVRGFASGRI